METSLKVLANPFEPFTGQPKIPDGRLQRSAGIRLRNTFQLTLDKTGIATHIAIIPGFGSVWCYSDGTTMLTPGPFPSHIQSAASVALIHSLRTVSTGVRFNLLNSPDQNEGYWEAARIPITASEVTNVNEGTDDRRVTMVRTVLEAYTSNLVNYPTYQTGRLRDLNKYVFKCNSVNVDHEFVAANSVCDKSFDMIVMKLRGRIDVDIPSTLLVESISNQEVKYDQDQALARLETPTTRLSNIETIMTRLNFKECAIII